MCHYTYTQTHTRASSQLIFICLLLIHTDPTNSSHQREEQEEKPTSTNDITVQDSSTVPLESEPDIVNSDESHNNMGSNTIDSSMDQDNNSTDMHKDETLINQETQLMTNGEINEEEAKKTSTEDEATNTIDSSMDQDNNSADIHKDETLINQETQPMTNGEINEEEPKMTSTEDEATNTIDSSMDQDNNSADMHKDETPINQETQLMTNGEISEEEPKMTSTEDEATSSFLSDKSISNAQSFIQCHINSDASMSLPPQPSPVESSTVTEIYNSSPSNMKALEQLKSVIGKTESSSDELGSANDEEKPVTSEPEASRPIETQKSPRNARKGQSRSVFYGASSPSPPPSTTTSSKSGKPKKSKSFKKNKIKEEVLQDPTALLPAPLSTMEWDPTCLLEELYSDCRPGISQSSTGENSRYSGYLDKLPVNQRKATVMKGWKHRYFRLTRGSLFYYDDEGSTKATSFIRLADSKIVIHPDSVKIEIIEKGSGNFIMLRAESKEELTTWHRVLQLEAVHPTMTHRLSLSPSRSATTLILDLGSSSVRAGLANDNTYPQVFFPNVCAVKDERVIACGIEALLPNMRRHVKLIYPCRHRVRLDANLPIKESFQCIIETTCKNLQIEPQNSCALVCISPVMSEAEQTLLVEVVLEVLGFQSILVQEQTTMALYSYNQTSGIVVSVGDTLDIVPIIDGFKLDSGCSHSPFGGHSITESLSKLATERDIRYFSETEMYIVRYIKENICFLSQDYPDDSILCEESPSDYIRAVDVDRFQLPDHKKVIHLDSALFKAPEGLFTPGVWGKDVAGIQEMVQKAIEHCPLDMRREMSRRIYLAGGTSLLIGFQERLQKELGLIFPRMEIQVQASENRQHASYLGAGVLASLNSFNTSLITLDEWSAKGLEAMKPTKT